jgi:hypothetical protein
MRLLLMELSLVRSKNMPFVDVIVKRCWPLDAHGATEKVRARKFH